MLMQPQEPTQPPAPGNYDFFLNPAQAPKPKKLPNVPGVRSPFLKRIILIVGGGIFLIIVIAILASVIFGSKSDTGLLTAAQAQTELIRVATEGTQQATVQTAKNLAVTTQLALDTDQGQLLAYAAKHGTKISTRQLGLTKNAATDQQLSNAQAASNFDAVFAGVMQTGLQAYLTSIQQTFKATANKSEQQVLNTDYVHAKLLLTQANTAVSAASQTQ